MKNKYLRSSWVITGAFGLFNAALCAGLAGSVTLWYLALTQPATPFIPSATTPLAQAISVENVAQLFVATAATNAPAVATLTLPKSVNVQGIISPNDASNRGNVAILAIEGQPMMAYQVGDAVFEGWRVSSINHESVVLVHQTGALQSLTSPTRPEITVLTP